MGRHRSQSLLICTNTELDNEDNALSTLSINFYLLIRQTLSFAFAHMGDGILLHAEKKHLETPLDRG